MHHVFFSSSSIKTIDWSGGKSSELFIYPEGSDFKLGNYSLRLSIATVEVESSTFTPLPGVSRTLMVLNGQLHLKHEGQYESILNPLEKDKFSGDWKTKSWGKVTDFNLMSQGECSGILNGYQLNKSQSFSINSIEENTFIHIYTGEVLLEDKTMTNGDSILMIDFNEINIDVMEDSLIVVVEFH